MEIENAVNQAKKELATRFDFKGSKAEIVHDKNEIKLSAEDEFKMRALHEIVINKLSKRQVSMKNIDKGQPDLSPLGHARQTIKIKQGIEAAVARMESSEWTSAGSCATCEGNGRRQIFVQHHTVDPISR